MQLLAPVTLGERSARNRLVFGPHETNLGRGRAISERHVAYYARRAAGGCGTIVTEIASVHAGDWPYERAPLASDCGPGWAAIVAACAEHGALVLAGLGHAGLQSSGAYSQRELWGPSPVPEVAGREVPKEMEDEDIAAVVAGFAEATRIAVEAGCGGVEINAGQHSLVRQFLSGLTNLRGDAYGTDKLRFAREVLTAVRKAAGTGIVGLRLSCDELAPWAGLTPESATQVAAELAAAGLVDYVAVVRGSIFSVASTRPDGHTPPAFNTDLARQVRAGLSHAGKAVPVMLQGSVVDLADAEAALTSGAADLVEMTRAQIADPDLGLAAAAGTRPRPCILCNQTCMVRDPRNPLVSCVGEPFAGYETSEPALVATRDPHDVLVIGAGPAGLETARVAAAAGHRVRVIERSQRIGGAVRVAAAGAGRERLGALVDWLEAECRRQGVTFETGVEADVTLLDDALHAGSRIVLCTGGRPGARAYTLESETVSASVVGADEVLEGALAGQLPDGPVAVWDPIGGPIGVSVAEKLVAAGADVTLITPDLLVGNELARSGDLAPASSRLQASGVTLVKRAVLRGVRAGVVDITDRFTGEEREIKANLVIDAGHRLPSDALWRERPELARAGDAVAPRTIYEAVLEGRRAAAALSEAGA
ncbi:MAG: NADH:flavin oxidoreductase/NADH oxidase [Mycobacterium sp.]|nr:NADH:flavin oxidoreductase/NADH oxidase [Mycobacterium sp.]